MTKPINFDECGCQCHRNPHIVHCMPCCSECPYCGARVIHYEVHIKEHHKDEPLPMPLPISVREIHVKLKHEGPVAPPSIEAFEVDIDV